MDIKIKICENGMLPYKVHPQDACYDCCSAQNSMIQPKETKLVKLGFCLELPDNWEAQIRPRSGMSKNGIFVQLGTVDSNYRGEVMACIYNSTEKPFEIIFGDRVCQMKIAKCYETNFVEVEELTETDRGSKGFGSSGIR